MATPVIYEVNIDLRGTIAAAYVAWLKPHIQEMFTLIEGLERADMCSRGDVPTPEARTGDGWVGVTVTYRVATQAALDDYLEHRAAAMRASALATFSTDDFAATRRIMPLTESWPKLE